MVSLYDQCKKLLDEFSRISQMSALQEIIEESRKAPRDRDEGLAFICGELYGLLDQLPLDQKESLLRTKQPFGHLDGSTSFKDFVARRIGGVSEFARRKPELFWRMCEQLQGKYPDAFDVVPPLANRGDAKPQTMLYGKCQTGKTKNSLVLAWLHWHFCSCVSFLGAWKYKSSVEGFAKAVSEFNKELENEFPDLLQEMRSSSHSNRNCLWYAMLHLRDREFDNEHLAQVLVLLSNPSRLTKLKDQLDLLSRVLSEKSKIIGKIPVVLLMDEDDVNTQTHKRDTCRTERLIFSLEYGHKEPSNDPALMDEEETDDEVINQDEMLALADSVYHYVGITATLHAVAIGNIQPTQNRTIQLKELHVTDDYYGFFLSNEHQNIPLESVEYHEDMLTMMQPMIEDGLRRLSSDIDSADQHQLHSHTVVQLIVPQTPTIVYMTGLANELAHFVEESLSENNIPILVSTFHGTAAHQPHNTLYFRNIDRDTVFAAAQELDILHKNCSQVSSEYDYLKLAGTALNAFKLMDLFKSISEKFHGVYCAIVSQNRAGRAVTFKDSAHELHLTDFMYGKSESAHDNFIQASHRIAGRYPQYTAANRRPPLKFWSTSNVRLYLQDVMAFHDEVIQKFSHSAQPFTPGSDIFKYSQDRYPKLTKPRVQRGLHINFEDPYTVEVLEVPLEAATHYSANQNELKALILERIVADLPNLVPFVTEANLEICARVTINNLDHQDSAILRECLHSERVTPKTQKIVQMCNNLQTHKKIHAIREKTWKLRCQSRPSTRKSFNSAHQSRATFGLKDQDLVTILWDEDVIEGQVRLHDTFSRTIHHDGAKILAYWYPRTAEPDSKYVLALDLPHEVPNRRNTAQIIAKGWVQADTAISEHQIESG